MGDKRRALAGLEDDRVAGQECGNEVAIGHMAWEIERADNGHHAVRLKARGRRHARHVALGFRAPFAPGFFGNGDLAHHGIKLSPSLPARLASLQANRFDDLLLPRLQALRVGLEKAQATGMKLIGPRLKRHPRRGDGGGDLSSIGGHAFPGERVRSGVARVERSSGPFNPLAVDKLARASRHGPPPFPGGRGVAGEG